MYSMDKNRWQAAMRSTGIICTVIAGIILIGCVSPSYYFHISYHHLKRIHDRKPVKVLINDPAIPQELKMKISLTQDRRFAPLPQPGFYCLTMTVTPPIQI